VSEIQNDWDEFTSALTFGYNCRIHSSLGYGPFELILSRPPPTFSVETPENGTADTAETARMRFLDLLKEQRPLEEETSGSACPIQSYILSLRAGEE
jgi:hypothetical protein